MKTSERPPSAPPPTRQTPSLGSAPSSQLYVPHTAERTESARPPLALADMAPPPSASSSSSRPSKGTSGPPPAPSAGSTSSSSRTGAGAPQSAAAAAAPAGRARAQSNVGARLLKKRQSVAYHAHPGVSYEGAPAMPPMPPMPQGAGQGPRAQPGAGAGAVGAQFVPGGPGLAPVASSSTIQHRAPSPQQQQKPQPQGPPRSARPEAESQLLATGLDVDQLASEGFKPEDCALFSACSRARGPARRLADTPSLAQSSSRASRAGGATAPRRWRTCAGSRGASRAP